MPASAVAVGRAITRLAPALRRCGIDVTGKRLQGKRLYVIEAKG